MKNFTSEIISVRPMCFILTNLTFDCYCFLYLKYVISQHYIKEVSLILLHFHNSIVLKNLAKIQQ